MQNSDTILVLGSANSDQFLKVKSFPQPGETISAHDQYFKNGGKGANIAVAAARLNINTYFSGQIGNEELGKAIEKEMTESGVQLDYLRRLDDVKTGQALIIIDNSAENMIIIYGGANTKYDTLDTLPTEYQEAIQKCKILILQMEIPIQINILAAKYAKQLGKIVVLDCGGRDDPITKEFLENIDFINPNETELARILQIEEQNIHDNSEIIREKLFEMNPNIQLILKLGAHGSLFMNKNQLISTKTVNNINPKINQDYQIVDTTGAGIEQFSDEDLKECLKFANSASFLCITQPGAMPSMPKLEVVEEFRNKYLKN